MVDTNFTAPQGDTWKGFTAEFLINDEAVDLTGALIKMQLRKTFCDSVVALEFSTEDGTILIDDPTNGRFSVEPRIINIPSKQYAYDVEVLLADGRVITIIQGKFIITPTVTR
jgi:hypothetical protein